MVAASAIPGRVPLGFVCGYPVGNGGELYGGSMFIKSAASYTPQGKAMQATNEKWGAGKWNGTETIGIAVCKKKYSPFSFYVEEDPNGRKVVKVERMFGCRCHTKTRRRVIELHGLRPGWEPFGQWSMRKAQELARRETERLNAVKFIVSGVINDEQKQSDIGDGDSGTTASTGASSSSSTSSSSAGTSIHFQDTTSSEDELKNFCTNGKCTWKLRSKFDNVYREVTGAESSDEEG